MKKTPKTMCGKKCYFSKQGVFFDPHFSLKKTCVVQKTPKSSFSQLIKNRDVMVKKRPLFGQLFGFAFCEKTRYVQFSWHVKNTKNAKNDIIFVIFDNFWQFWTILIDFGQFWAILRFLSCFEWILALKMRLKIDPSEHHVKRTST